MSATKSNVRKFLDRIGADVVIPVQSDAEAFTIYNSRQELIRHLVPLPESDGGADFSLVYLDEFGRPACSDHGAMNKVAPSPPEGGGFWRCITLAGPKTNPCRAGCRELESARG